MSLSESISFVAWLLGIFVACFGFFGWLFLKHYKLYDKNRAKMKADASKLWHAFADMCEFIIDSYRMAWRQQNKNWVLKLFIGIALIAFLGTTITFFVLAVYFPLKRAIAVYRTDQDFQRKVDNAPPDSIFSMLWKKSDKYKTSH